MQCLFNIADGLGRCGKEALHRAGFALTFGDFVQSAFRGFDLALGVNALARVERIVDQRAANRHQFTQQREVINLLRKVTRADQASAICRQLNQIARSPKLPHGFVGFEKWLQRDGRHQHVPVNQTQYLFVNAAVQRFKEMVGLKFDRNIFDHPVINQNCAKKRGLRLNIAGKALGFSFIRCCKSDKFGHGSLSFSMCSFARGTQKEVRGYGCGQQSDNKMFHKWDSACPKNISS